MLCSRQRMASCRLSQASWRQASPRAAPALSHQHQPSGITRRGSPSTSATAVGTAPALPDIPHPSQPTVQLGPTLGLSLAHHSLTGLLGCTRSRPSRSPTLACPPAGDHPGLSHRARGHMDGAGAVPLATQALHLALPLASWALARWPCRRGLGDAAVSWDQPEAGAGPDRGQALVPDQCWAQ